MNFNVFRGLNVVVFQCNGKEAIVYGGGSDWYAQLSEVTNHVHPWRKWFGKCSLAEDAAKNMISEN